MKKYWIGALLLTSMPAWAILPYAATQAEQAMCQARVYSRVDRSDPKRGGHMHHYCDGLRFIDRAYAAMGNKQDMRHYLNESIGNFNYVLTHTQEDYVMRGEVHVGKARALKLMGKHGESMTELTRALRYNPDSPDVYQALADYHQDTGNKPKALEMITEGLRRNPGSKGLKRRYTELGGKLPYTEAVAKTMPTEAARDEVKPEVKSEAAPPSGETTSQAADAPSEQIKFKTKGKAEAEPVPASAQTTPAEPVAAPKIGSPKNPYCRFCTD